ncbi:MAG: class I SAM-dependent methyltransferase [Defluviitaleaceae bacterium]|nr:class I SAM-dependent methyltransferase [Defluviitaleaceae bacterium]MCL2261615.1 class I SAM-dependent methyltransferase [Defluviitaleaceae bacterium]
MDYKTRIYDDYTNTTRMHHDTNKIESYYKLHEAYFKKNYLRFMPTNKNALVVDIGCGIGAFLNFATNQGYANVIGIDLSGENIEICKGKGFNAEKVNAFDFFKQHAGAIDCIVFNEVIEHLEKQEVFDMLDAMKAGLSDNGVLLIKTPNMSNPYTGPASLSINITHQLCFTEISMRQVLFSVGFSDINIIGTDIYVKKNPLNFIAKQIARLIRFDLYMKSWLFGRKTIKIFHKNILAIAKK